MKTTLFDNGDFAYLVDIKPLTDPVCGFSLKVSSLWRSARDGEAEQVRFQACLDRTGLTNLASLIECQINPQKGVGA